MLQLMRVRYETYDYEESRRTIQAIVEAAETGGGEETGSEGESAAKTLRLLLEDENPVTVEESETRRTVALLQRVAQSRGQAVDDDDAETRNMRASALRLARTLQAASRDGQPLNLVLA